MANTIKLKRSSTASDTPTASDLEVGELAINTADAKLFTKHTDNSIKEISGSGGNTFTSDVTITSSGTNQSANLMLNNTETSSNFGKAIEAYRSGIGTGQRNQIMLGKDGSTNDTSTLSFYYAGNASSSNRFEVGFWGADSLLNVLADGNVGIGNTSPSYKLDVAGDINFTGSLYQNGSAFSGGGGGSSNLTGLSDVTISSVQNNDLLKYNSTAGEWQNTNLGVTVAPSVSIDSSIYIGNRTATLTPSSGTYDLPAYFAEVRNAANTATLVTNENITKSGNTLTWSQTTTGVNLILRVKTQDFGDLESEFTNQTFTASSFPIRRYYRLIGTGGNSHTIVRDISLYTGLGQTGTNYPPTMTADDAPSPYVATSSGHYNSTSYENWKAFDSSTVSGWWNLAQGATYSNWYIQIDFGSSSSVAINSAKITINPSYQGGTLGQTYTLAGSDTGAFTGEQITMGSFTGSISGTGEILIN